MAQDHRVNDATERHHGTVELLLDPLRLPQIKRLDVQYARLGDFLGQLLEATLDKVLPVAHENDELAQVALEDLSGNSGAHSSRRTGQEHALTRELVLELERGLVRLGDLLLLLDRRLCTGRGSRLHSEKAREQAAEAEALRLDLLLLGSAIACSGLLAGSGISLGLPGELCHFQILSYCYLIN